MYIILKLESSSFQNRKAIENRLKNDDVVIVRVRAVHEKRFLNNNLKILGC